MKRKKFLASLSAMGAGLMLNAQNRDNDLSDGDEWAPPVMRIPPYLKKGDTIGITCPAGYLLPEDLAPAVQKMEEWGFVIKTGTTVGTRSGTFSAADEERAADLQRMLNDRTIKAIMCGRGGYGVNRVIDRLNFQQFVRHPKWIIGFSDITLLHTHLNTRLRVASVHSKMCNSFLKDWSAGEPLQIQSIESIQKALLGEKMNYTATAHAKNRTGKAEGVLVGGNLSIIFSAQKTVSELNTDGAILFLEEVGEYLYSLDRMLWNLKRSGKLAKLKGLVVGGFRVKPSEDPAEEFGQDIYEIV
ncbi:MAG: LD-carboxypeptidase, partial [Dinghuibacter sp.]|nr:LD-carboxypeptidase [Dinghuibacter sp.]